MRYAAFLRAINVGGHVVKMDQLRKHFEAAGFREVATVIASGNVVFESSKKSGDGIERAIASHLEKALGYPVATFVRSMTELAAIAERAPFGRAPVDAPSPASVLIGFLRTPTSRDAGRQLAALSNNTDTLVAVGREVFWFARKGIAESTISYSVVEKLLGTEATFRNVNTVRRMAAKYCAP
jgi:uncharacterized protein (DUF1697 family)